MTSGNFVLISKDALCTDYLKIYGEKKFQFNTPNIDDLAHKGLLYTNYFTAAPSTVMSFFSMITSLFPHETTFQLYERKSVKFNGETIFKRLRKLGFEECHIIWDPAWTAAKDYFDCYGNDVTIHEIVDLKQKVGVHRDHNIISNIKSFNEVRIELCELLQKLSNNNKKIFLWIHFPHVLNGRFSYGSDIDLFDELVGDIRKYFNDTNIAITADHGNLNGLKGKLSYGFDLYNKAIKIPLITSAKTQPGVVRQNLSSTKLFEILFLNDLPKENFIYSDTAYRAQPQRKIAIIKNNYKYIYTKATKKEELYDMEFDPLEQFSLMEDKLYDTDRKIFVNCNESYFYPKWDNIKKIRNEFRIEKNRIWRDGDFLIEIKCNLKELLKPFYRQIENYFK